MIRFRFLGLETTILSRMEGMRRAGLLHSIPSPTPDQGVLAGRPPTTRRPYLARVKPNPVVYRMSFFRRPGAGLLK